MALPLAEAVFLFFVVFILQHLYFKSAKHDRINRLLDDVETKKKDPSTTSVVSQAQKNRTSTTTNTLDAQLRAPPERKSAASREQLRAEMKEQLKAELKAEMKEELLRELREEMKAD